MKLSRDIFHKIPPHANVQIPDTAVFSLPEKIVQFGTGVFLRGFIDFIIDKANETQVFNGRVVVVKSTDSGTDIDLFEEQDNLYTVVLRSSEEGVKREEKRICSAISRVMHAKDWDSVLRLAEDKTIQIIVSNTTEAGISLDENDSTEDKPPKSYPGKLLSFLFHRYRFFKNSPDSGMVIIPTELIPDNATKLKEIILQLAERNGLDSQFVKWLHEENDFCNSLVDRIVPGKPADEKMDEWISLLGYEDHLMVAGETYGLWAIETSKELTRQRLTFNQAFEGVHIVPNIEKFRELKLRLLNGSHNLSCAVGFLAGFKTVDEAMADEKFNAFMETLIMHDIARSIVSDTITLEEAQEFGKKVMERYANPYVKFNWLSICVQDTTKIRIRAVPVVLEHYRKYNFVPDTFCLGFAAYILFMKATPDPKGKFEGRFRGETYEIEDDFAELLSRKWADLHGLSLVKSVLSDTDIWGEDLSVIEGFCERVLEFLEVISNMEFDRAFESIEISE